MVAFPLECQKGMRFDIELRELPEPQQGRREQRLQTQQARFLFMMAQGKVFRWVLLALGLNRLLQEGHAHA